MAKFKEGVSLDFSTLKPTTARIVEVAELVFWRHGYDTIITSANDGSHMAMSKHYSDDAIDFRTHHVPTIEEKQQIKSEIATRLGNLYDVILEDTGQANEHLHVEYDPKFS